MDDRQARVFFEAIAVFFRKRKQDFPHLCIIQIKKTAELMKTLKQILATGCIVTAMTGCLAGMQACSVTDDNAYGSGHQVLATAKTLDNGTFVLQQDKYHMLRPVNIPKSPFNDKEVRVIVSYTELGEQLSTPIYYMDVNVRNLDSIRTKLPVAATEDWQATYGNDCIEIVDDIINSLYDGYLTLCFSTRWESPSLPHQVNLITGVNPDDPYEVELCHDANGDKSGQPIRTLIAFRLDQLPLPDDDRKLTLRWKSESGMKTVQFNINRDLLTQN